MGRRLDDILAALPPEHAALLAAYQTALRRAGVSAVPFPNKARGDRHWTPEAGSMSPLGNRSAGARHWLQRWGPDGWRRLPVDEQVAILVARQPSALAAGVRGFVCWLGLTGRLPFPPALLEALEACPRTGIFWLAHGRVAFPDLMVRLADTARKLGYRQDTADSVCRAVTLAVAHAGTSPEALTLDELVALSDAMRVRRAARRAARGQQLKRGGYEHQPLNPWTTGTVLYHAGLLPAPPATQLIGRREAVPLEEAQLGFLRERWPHFYDLLTRYLARRRATRRPGTHKSDAMGLGAFFRWLTAHHPEVTELRQLDRRTHIEPYLRWLFAEDDQAPGPGRARDDRHWTLTTRHGRLQILQRFLRHLAAWGWPEAPPRALVLADDLPRLPELLPRAFDDVEAARMVQVARAATDPLERLILELLAGCGLRAGEARDIRLSDIVAFGGTAGPTAPRGAGADRDPDHAGLAGHPAHAAAQPWLRVPLGKLANDRYVPIGPDLQAALDAFLAAERSTREWERLPAPPEWTTYLLARRGRRVSDAYCNQVVHRVAQRAGVAGAHSHRWRHTFATQAINRGMDLATIATLLGHRRLDMTMVYARIANPRLRQEFERVSEQVRGFYAAVALDPPEAPGAPGAPAGAGTATVLLPAGVLGPAMVVTRRELEWRRLGNGWCTRRAYLDCRYELVCERCVHFNTDRLFLPVLEAQREDAARKGQQARVELFGQLITALNEAEQPAQPAPTPPARAISGRRLPVLQAPHLPPVPPVLPVVSGPQVADFSDPNTTPATGGLA
jgi:site-specific recombinase XerD